MSVIYCQWGNTYNPLLYQNEKNSLMNQPMFIPKTSCLFNILFILLLENSHSFAHSLITIRTISAKHKMKTTQTVATFSSIKSPTSTNLEFPRLKNFTNVFRKLLTTPPKTTPQPHTPQLTGPYSRPPPKKPAVVPVE